MIYLIGVGVIFLHTSFTLLLKVAHWKSSFGNIRSVKSKFFSVIIFSFCFPYTL